MKAATIVDVAKRAGISVSTVSNVLNGRGDRMQAETRARVEAAISALGYVPSRVARQLKTGRSPVIGLTVPSVANPFFGELTTAIERAAQTLSHQIVLCNTHRDPDLEKTFAADLRQMGVRGLISGSAPLDPGYLAELVADGFRVVAFDAPGIGQAQNGLATVAVDNECAVRLAVEHLVDFGHRRIAYVTAPPRTASRAARLAGFRNAAAGFGTRLSPFVHEIQLNEGEYGDDMIAVLGIGAARDLLTYADRPTGIVAMNDLLAIGIAAGMREAGLDVGTDVSLIGIDDLFLAAIMNPTLTSIRQPLQEMADAAVRSIVSSLDTGTSKAVDGLFRPELIVRQSTGRTKLDELLEA